MEDIPFVAFSNDELDEKDLIGETVICPGCNEVHPVKYGEKVLTDGTKVPTKMLAFVSCPNKDSSYLVGINGKQVFKGKIDEFGGKINE